MKLHLVTVGKPRLPYAAAGWQEYLGRLERFHTVRTTHLSDKYAADPARFRQAIGPAYAVALVIESGRQFSSEELAGFLAGQALSGRELCCLIGGPDGLPPEIIAAAPLGWSFGRLTLPHDLAMVVLAEALYRASSINAGLPYHRG